MRPSVPAHLISRSLVLVFSLLLTHSFIASVLGQTPQEFAEMKKKVDELQREQKFTEALPLLEKLVTGLPNDAYVQYLYGHSLIAQANTVKDDAVERQLRIKARNAFLKSRELGYQSALLDAFIETMSPDGRVNGKFSQNILAEFAMKEAEGFFSQGKLDEAFEFYQKALKLDPKIYEAALFSGDVFMQKANYDQAEIWYQKAISINPERETAYRYSATPFMKQKKYDQARDRYIEAFIVEPYSRFSVVGISQWAQVTGALLGHPRIDIPASIGTSGNGNIKITLGADDKSDDGSFAWTAYAMHRALWQSGDTGLSSDFKKAYPGETSYRHSLAEEFSALKMTVVVLKERMSAKDNPVKKLHPQLEKLLAIHADGLLEAYILMAKPDAGIARDYPGYLKQNREKLRQYVSKYVITVK
jgi:tetratricopeptide (TPR) repeat protein